MEGGPCDVEVDGIAAHRDLALETQRPRLPATLAVLTAEGEGPIGRAGRVVGIARHQLRLGEGGDHESVAVGESDRAGVTIRAVEDLEGLVEAAG